MNELIFLLHTSLIALIVLGAQKSGKQALTVTVCLFAILANLFVAKQITLFGYHATTTDALSVGAFLALNLMQEYYGRSATRTTIWISFACGLLYTALSIIQLWYVPNDFDTSNPHYQVLLSPMPRIMVSSLITYVIAEYIDYYLYGLLKNFAPRLLILRTSGSLVISQFIDTVLFTFLALYGTHAALWDIITISYAIKLMTIGLTAPFIALSLYLSNKSNPA